MYEDSDWAIRWVVVDTGDWLSGRRVLLPVAAVGQPDPEAHCLPARLTMEQVEESAGVDSVRTASGKSDALGCEHDNLPKVAITLFGAITTARRLLRSCSTRRGFCQHQW